MVHKVVSTQVAIYSCTTVCRIREHAPDSVTFVCRQCCCWKQLERQHDQQCQCECQPVLQCRWRHLQWPAAGHSDITAPLPLAGYVWQISIQRHSLLKNATIFFEEWYMDMYGMWDVGFIHWCWRRGRKRSCWYLFNNKKKNTGTIVLFLI